MRSGLVTEEKEKLRVDRMGKFSHLTGRLLTTQNDPLQWVFNVLRTWHCGFLIDILFTLYIY